jgi:hypothetical protein
VEDQKLEALTQAEFYWRKAFYADKLTKLAYAEDLNNYGAFSLTQLAKIVRSHTSELTRYGIQGGARGGRFEPETLSTLIHLRKLRMKGERIPTNLIELAVAGGTSWSCASYLTGIAYSSYYNQGGEQTGSIRATPLKPTEKQAIVIALRAGANAQLLAEQYKITTDYVMEIFKAHGNV